MSDREVLINKTADVISEWFPQPLPSTTAVGIAQVVVAAIEPVVRSQALKDVAGKVNTKSSFWEVLSRSDAPVMRQVFKAWLIEQADIEARS